MPPELAAEPDELSDDSSDTLPDDPDLGTPFPEPEMMDPASQDVEPKDELASSSSAVPPRNASNMAWRSTR